ncbi:MAG: hypothetical protein ABIR68_07050 [Ilumatobacteraceae bacterium]
MSSRRRINRRWAAPVIALVAIAGIGVGPSMLRANASSPDLPPLTPAELLVKARTAQVTALSGTVQLISNLGLPSLDSLGGLGGGSDTSVASLLSGTHSAQVWMDGADKVRVTTTAPLAETNWIRNGTDLWSYDSATLTATHATIPAGTADARDPDTSTSGDATTRTSSVPDPAHDTPVEFAQLLIDEVTPSTGVAVDSTTRVAGRDAYRLVLTPNAADSTIGTVTLAVDAATGLPLDVKITGKSSGDTAFELGFTSIDFSAPPASTFEFTPPPEATVVEAKDATDLLDAGGRMSDRRHRGDRGADTSADTTANAATAPSSTGTADTTRPSAIGKLGNRVTTVGTDWTTSAIISGANLASQIGPLLNGADRITVGTASARVIPTTLFTVLVLDDGRIAVGAVQPAALAALVAGAPS